MYRTYNKENGATLDECVCRLCAIKIHNDKDSKITVYYDIYATNCFDSDIDSKSRLSDIGEGFDDDMQVEICPICESDIPRGDGNWIPFEVPVNIEHS